MRQLSLFPAQFPSSSNRVMDEDAPIHNWYRFVLAFPPHLVRHYLTEFNASAQSLVCDPFCGSGTTLVECKKMHIPSIGLDVNPMGIFASQTKLEWDICPTSLVQEAQQIAREAQSIANQETDWRSLPAETEMLLIQNSISPQPLHETLVLLDHIEAHAAHHRDLYRLILAQSTVKNASNLRFAPEVCVGKSKTNIGAISFWLEAVKRAGGDLQQWHTNKTPATAQEGDARTISTTIAPQSLNLVVSSPPYPTERDYSRATRLESVLLGLIPNRTALRTSKQKAVRSHSRGIYIGDQDDQWVKNFDSIQAIATQIESQRLRMGKDSGFERAYARTILLYFGGMAQHFADLRVCLKPGATLVYTVGDTCSYLQVPIATGALLAEIAESLGYRVLRKDLFRTRFASVSKSWLREENLILKWDQ